MPLARALVTAQRHDYLDAYVADLPNVVDMHAISAEGIRIGADPLGGASVDYWGAIAERHNLDLTVVNPLVDATWRFMTLDTDGKIRMDCSSPNAMAALVQKVIGDADSYQIATGNDADSDRHGIVTPDGGLLNPNHYLAVAIDYLFAHRPEWAAGTAVGKTAVSSSIIDRVVAGLGRKLVEVPVGFKWFVDGLIGGTIGFGGEESAGASFLRRDGSVWTTDKDGIILALLASEILAVTGSTPSQRYAELAGQYGAPTYARIDAPADREQKARLAKLSPEQVTATELAGEAITAKLTTAPGNGAPLGGLKVTTENAWFAARPSGTEDVYKIYAESFRGPEHLAEVQDAAREVVQQGHRVSSGAEGECPAAQAEAKQRLPREVWLLVAANVVVALGYGVVAPVLPQYARHFGVSISAATFVITAFAVMRLVAAPPAGLLVQRLGERRVYISGLLIVAVSTAVCAFAETYWQLLLFRSLGGLGSAMFTVSSLGLMIRISPPDARGRVAGLFSSGFLIGSVGGPVLGSLTVGLRTGGAVLDLRGRADGRRDCRVRQSAQVRGGRPVGGGPGAADAVPNGVPAPGLPGRAVLQLRDGMGVVRVAHRPGAAVHRGGAGPGSWRRGSGADDVRDRQHLGRHPQRISVGPDRAPQAADRRAHVGGGLDVAGRASPPRCRCSWRPPTSPGRRPASSSRRSRRRSPTSWATSPAAERRSRRSR